MGWAKEAGLDPVDIANAMMAVGGNLPGERWLASIGYANADTYAYSPGGPPVVPTGIGSTFPGGGGGGGVASPAV
jgi:hypothetical protein